MRNLTPTGLQVNSVRELCRSGHVAAFAVDVESDGMLVVVERKGDEGDVEVDIVRITEGNDTKALSKVGWLLPRPGRPADTWIR